MMNSHLFKSLVENDLVGAVVVGFVLFAVVKLTSYYTKNTIKTEQIEKRIDRFSDEVNEKLQKHSDAISQIKIDLGVIKQLIRNHLGNTVDSVISASSPLTLADLGKEISKNIGAEEILAKHWQRLEEIVLGAEPPTTYHLQRECLNAVERHLEPLLSQQELEAVAAEAFQRGLHLSNVLGIIGILLRDKLIEEHPQWSFGDIGGSSPC